MAKVLVVGILEELYNLLFTSCEIRGQSHVLPGCRVVTYSSYRSRVVNVILQTDGCGASHANIAQPRSQRGIE